MPNDWNIIIRLVEDLVRLQIGSTAGDCVFRTLPFGQAMKSDPKRTIEQLKKENKFGRHLQIGFR